MSDVNLIVNADDLGMSRGITDGIIVAHRYGLVTSASLMANMPDAERALMRAKDLPRLGVGVHLNICQGRPVSPPNEIPTLVDQTGTFLSPAKIARNLLYGRVSQREIEAEFRAQIRWMKERGLEPTHADSHHHVHLYPAAARPFVRALEAEGVRCIRSARCATWPKSSSWGGPHEGSVVRRLLVQGYRATLQRTLLRRFESTDSRISFHSHDRKNSPALYERWKAALENLPAGIFELACHPGLFERGFSETDAIRAQREMEMAWLTDPDLRQIIDARGIRLVTYRTLTGTEGLHPVGLEAAAS